MSIIEKHFTDNIKLRLSDNFFSVTYDEVVKIKQNIKKVFTYMHNKIQILKILGDFKKYK